MTRFKCRVFPTLTTMKTTITPEHKKLAKQIAKSLFTNGFGERAQRLVLELPEGKNGGGWAEVAVVDVIAEHLAKQDKASTTKRKAK